MHHRISINSYWVFEATLVKAYKLSILFLLPQFGGCLFKKAPTAPRYPSCLKKYAFFPPLDQNLIAYDSVAMVCQ